MIQNCEIQVGSGSTMFNLDPQHYPDGMPFVKGIVLASANTMVLRPKSLETFVTAMFLVDSLYERGIDIKRLILPHVPGGRQDRINPTGDILFTLKSVAQMINDREFEQVVVFDPHSAVTPALLDRCDVVTPAEILKGFWKGYSGVIAPDVGAAKRAFDVAQALGLDFHQAEKHRNVSTGKLSGFAAPTLKAGEHYLVVDDICDGGGTFLGLGKVIQDAGAFADLYVTHGVFSNGLGNLLKVYKKVTTTDTTTFDHGGALTIPAVNRYLSE